METQMKLRLPAGRIRWWKFPLARWLGDTIAWAVFALMPLLSFTLVELLNYNQPWTSFSTGQVSTWARHTTRGSSSPGKNRTSSGQKP